MHTINKGFICYLFWYLYIIEALNCLIDPEKWKKFAFVNDEWFSISFVKYYYYCCLQPIGAFIQQSNIIYMFCEGFMSWGEKGFKEIIKWPASKEWIFFLL